MKIYYTDNSNWRDNIPVDWWDIPDIPDVEEQRCLHKSCPECGGTGIKKNGLGMCIHMISCPCRKCTPIY